MKMPYTKSLMRSIPKLEDPSHTRLLTIAGRPPDLVNPPTGCRFAPRCAVRPRPVPRRGAAARHRRRRRPSTSTPAGIPVGSPEFRGTRRRDHVTAGRQSPEPVTLMAGTGKAHLRDGDDVVLRVEDLVVEFPVGRTGHGQRGRGHQLRRAARRDARHRRRVRLRQVAPPAGRSCSSRARRPARSCSRARELTTLGAQRTARGAHEDADDLPGPDLVAQPAPQGPRHRDGAARHLGARHASRAAGELVDDILEQVGIDPDRAAESRPHQFSGGQCQRISIARSLVLDPTLIICDEPVSALDVSVQAQVLNLLEDLKAEYGLTLIFIAHDLAVVKNISDRVAVMYLGKLCEVASSDDLYGRPAHHYTNVLLESIPVPDPEVAVDRHHDHRRAAVAGHPAARAAASTRAARPPTTSASTTEPELRSIGDGHFVACHHPSRHAGRRRLRSSRPHEPGRPVEAWNDGVRMTTTDQAWTNVESLRSLRRTLSMYRLRLRRPDDRGSPTGRFIAGHAHARRPGHVAAPWRDDPASGRGVRPRPPTPGGRVPTWLLERVDTITGRRRPGSACSMRPTRRSSVRCVSVATVASRRRATLYHQLLPTIIAQRITAGEAVRQWARLCYRLGQPAPGPPDVTQGLRAPARSSEPAPSTGVVVPPARHRDQARPRAHRGRTPRRQAVGVDRSGRDDARREARTDPRRRTLDRRFGAGAGGSATPTLSPSATTTSPTRWPGRWPANHAPTTTACSNCSSPTAGSVAGCCGRSSRPPARRPNFGPRQRIMPVARW